MLDPIIVVLDYIEYAHSVKNNLDSAEDLLLEAGQRSSVRTVTIQRGRNASGKGIARGFCNSL